MESKGTASNSQHQLITLDGSAFVTVGLNQHKMLMRPSKNPITRDRELKKLLGSNQHKIAFNLINAKKRKSITIETINSDRDWQELKKFFRKQKSTRDSNAMKTSNKFATLTPVNRKKGRNHYHIIEFNSNYR